MRFARSALVIAPGFLSEHVVVVDGVMMAGVAEFGVAWFDKLEDNAVSTIDAEASYFVLFGVQLFYVQ